MLFQFCYASKALSDPQSLLSDLRDILNEAHHFNYLNHINGVLYFADGYFFQCLEGDQTTIMQLFEKIKKDRRHEQVYAFPARNVEQGLFQDWSMKFVRKNSAISIFFQQLGQESFNPYLLNKDSICAFIPLLAEIEMDQVS
ncbi:BLUF domain-containing protein [Acinetobacter haemolyticus]|uniref:BLUF domain-containing protein n=1 Tax=Acinetobacter haemolyticus TaxID=29430 RepID=UPI001331D6C1|nr:BLUF domain-containing protein [Acinetobacter haemolyticus]NAR60069.1 blue light sensor protein [Acinetobacter haemolyticus]NAR67107.1 blue light sensor protein [Acinetobacter haemolyticus]NAR69225.1 blue light sensor protein [Acinetobacter haemolyticus]NAR82192.1 blue light sensor protein [Acinetobacter haemolyticus]NAR92470.1 blue light sensor protein [Acinetobacter haemolyticus]